MQLRYLKYAVSQPDSHYVRLALAEQMRLDSEHGSGWLTDLRRHLYTLGAPLSPEFNAAAIDLCIAPLKKSMQATLKDEVDASPKLEILRSRVEYDNKGRSASPMLSFVTICTFVIRPLDVPSPDRSSQITGSQLRCSVVQARKDRILSRAGLAYAASA